MKTLNLAILSLLLSVHSGALWSQVISTETETSNNEALLQNAKDARAAVEKANEDKPQQQIRVLGTGQVDTSVSNLTDQEVQLSQEYVHQGKANEILKANCEGDMKSVCNGEEGKHKFMGMDPSMVKAVSQAYAAFGAVAGDAMGLKKGPKSKKDKVTDYCAYIPTGTEAIATAVQTAQTSELAKTEVGDGETAQKEALLKAAKSHDSRAKMAQVQAVGWFGGAACYVASAAAGQFAVNGGLALKVGGATLLGAFYQNEVGANKDYAEKTREIADQLPGKGDCNPITDKLCYCSQPSTESDPTYCMPNLHKKKLAATSYRLACTDEKMQLDPTCTCEKTNTCFDNFLMNQSDGSLQLSGLGSETSAFNSIRSLSRGELVGGTLNSKSYDQTAAIAKQGLRDITSKLPPLTTDLTKDQMKVAQAIMSKGIPSHVAALMAQNPVSSGAEAAALAKIQGMGGFKPTPVVPRVSNIIDFTGGNGGSKGKGVGTGGDDILGKLKMGATKSANNSNVLEFAQKAEDEANKKGQIRKNDTPLFEIISLRYQISGRKRLELDAGK